MSFWTIILLGIIEGVTEFLPVSSTGHLLLVEHWLNLPAQPSELFNVVIQTGAVLAVILVFSGRLRQLVNDWRAPATRDYVLKLTTAFLITCLGGLILKKLGMELPSNPAPVAWATFLGGIAILAIERYLKQQSGAGFVSWTMAVAVGAAQIVAAAFPGTSRSGISIIVALLLGLSRPAATEFSFLVGVPTLLAAGAYKTLSALNDHTQAHEPWSHILIGTLAAAITAFIVVRWLLRFVQDHTFIIFGWYRIILGAFILGMLVYSR